MKRRNPDDLTLLHRIRFKVRKYKVGLAIEVYDGPQQIARGKFFKGPWTARLWEKDKVVEAVIIEVEKPWQRKGVASAIYRKVEELGYTIHPSSAQTPSGHKLWQGGRWGKREEVINSGILSRWKTEYARKNPGDEAELVRLAFAEYGVTRDFAECGYIMTDGRMLDFSEKRDGGNPGTRSLDHRAVYGIVKKAGFEVENRGYGSESNSVKAFLEACGAVRVMFMEGGGSYRGKPVGNIFYLHVARRPTAAQLLTISSAIRKYNPELVQVAFGESVDMVEIEPVTAGRVRQVLESIS